MSTGKVRVYYGDGRGKTSAAWDVPYMRRVTGDL